jgi:hypothetical protein
MMCKIAAEDFISFRNDPRFINIHRDHLIKILGYKKNFKNQYHVFLAVEDWIKAHNQSGSSFDYFNDKIALNKANISLKDRIDFSGFSYQQMQHVFDSGLLSDANILELSKIYFRMGNLSKERPKIERGKAYYNHDMTPDSKSHEVSWRIPNVTELLSQQTFDLRSDPFLVNGYQCES